MVSAFYLRCASVPSVGQEQGVKQVFYHGSLGSVVNMNVCFLPEDWFVLYVPIPQTLRNVLREAVIVSRIVPTHSQDTPAPVTLGIRSVRMGIHVTVRTNNYAITTANDALSIS